MIEPVFETQHILCKHMNKLVIPNTAQDLYIISEHNKLNNKQQIVCALFPKIQSY